MQKRVNSMVLCLKMILEGKKRFDKNHQSKLSMFVDFSADSQSFDVSIQTRIQHECGIPFAIKIFKESIQAYLFFTAYSVQPLFSYFILMDLS